MLRRGFLLQGSLPKNVNSRWPKAFIDIFYAFRDFIQPIARQSMFFTDEEPEDRADDLKELLLRFDHHYQSVLRFFDEELQP
jgi:hypothetical protein